MGSADGRRYAARAMKSKPAASRRASKPSAASSRDARVDAYIERAAAFAQPVLHELRARLHAVCPGLCETIKWGAPAFEHHGLLAGMAAFKKHCAFGFWKNDLLVAESAAWKQMSERLGRLTAVEDLPGKREFQRLLKRAMELNESGVKVAREKKAKPAVVMHPELARALAASAKARQQFAAFSPSKQREYLEWIADAKAEATRQRRVEQAVEWIAEGKGRNWKYERC